MPHPHPVLTSSRGRLYQAAFAAMVIVATLCGFGQWACAAGDSVQIAIDSIIAIDSAIADSRSIDLESSDSLISDSLTADVISPDTTLTDASVIAPGSRDSSSEEISLSDTNVVDSVTVDTSAADTVTVNDVVIDSVIPPPSFYQIIEWEITTTRFSDRAAAIQAVDALGEFYGKPLSRTAIRDATISPLEWPPVFADQRVNSRRLRYETESLLDAAGLAYRVIAALESGELADSVTAAISSGSPVLFNTPQAPIFYGYDRRESDPWWWVQLGAATEIVYESERVERYHYWDDNPTANLAWIITGFLPESENAPEPGGAEYRFLDGIRRSVEGHPESGIVPYPLTLRDLGDRLQDNGTLPDLMLPVDSVDPIGVYRALGVRQRLIESLERMIPMALDTSLSAPLRLAQYFYYNSTRALISFAETLYERPDAADRLFALRENWQDDDRRARAHEFLQKVLRAEKDAHGALSEAVAAYRSSFDH